MNKRFLTIAAALSMGVALTACSSGGDEGKTVIRNQIGSTKSWLQELQG